jgi:hypothetical protein
MVDSRDQIRLIGSIQTRKLDGAALGRYLIYQGMK